MNVKHGTFRGGIHPPYGKESTAAVPLEFGEKPKMVTIPMSMHIGAPCTPNVKKGEYVYLGQKIGEPNGFVSVPIHASVSGKVVAVEVRPHPSGDRVMSVVIESDGLDILEPSIKPYGSLEKMDAESIKNMILNAGIVGLGGATFPTHVKLTVPPDKKVDSIILNGAECEPYLTADHHLMRTQAEKIVLGLKVAMKAVGVEKGFIGIEDNKGEAIQALTKAIGNDLNLEIYSLHTKYPQGAEKQLITAITGREVPSGGLPADAGVVVMNVGTAAQIAESMTTGMPLYKRLLTCTGDAIKNPQTLAIRIGVSFQSVIDQCGGFISEPQKVISGGPMMGVSQFETEVPVIKGTSGILCLTKEFANVSIPSNCIRCGKCLSVCPIHLEPLNLAEYSQKNKWKQCEENHIMDCIECGSCSYICPAKRTLVSSIRVAKREIVAQRRKGN
ncbi:electron transport complex subunit RsxC [Acetobacterium tundrae]|uniref:Ion-translocating oxidoreductase complex subunit C n=1 Tax=Acetobacterium tundrae TaxID=132932 RepID=A0ABR6WMY5_9FIRM|nr:electron transport complex subunit RsxC [Acetobacterium tundrae]MBC3797666.1 electron transport complex subunit RsxC [Acetobacterium tundrae]